MLTDWQITRQSAAPADDRTYNLVVSRVAKLWKLNDPIQGYDFRPIQSEEWEIKSAFKLVQTLYFFQHSHNVSKAVNIKLVSTISFTHTHTHTHTHIDN
jgi:hypothetical protein